MKSDIDRLMAERDLAALIIPVDEVYSPPLDYLVGRVHITGGLAIKKQGADPVLVVSGMEVQEAEATGLKVYSYAQMDYYDIYKANAHDTTQTAVAFWVHCLEKLDITVGKIGVYGVGRMHRFIALVDRLREAHKQYQFNGEAGRTLFDIAAITKDEAEVARLRDIGTRTSVVQQAAWDFIASHHAQGDTVVDGDGKPLTIGAVKRFIRRTLLDYDLEDTGMIFAQGRDGAFPHSRGQDDMALKQGETIVFDLFPREIGGGYYHDTTRTWSIGYASEDAQRIYQTVMDSFDVAVEAYGLDKPAYLMAEAVLDFFEAQDHPTIRSHPGTETGFVHGLGHGLGVEIHEQPYVSHTYREDRFQVGNVITIEPGLYYPDKAIGARVEDTFVVNPDGTLESITPFHKDLVIPLKST